MGARGELLTYKYVKGTSNILTIEVDKNVRRLLKEGMGIVLETDTDQLHISTGHIHQMKNEGSTVDSTIDDLFDLVDWSHYGKKPLRPKDLYAERKYVVETAGNWEEFVRIHSKYTGRTNLNNQTKSPSKFVFLNNSTVSDNRQYCIDENQTILTFQEYKNIMGEPMNNKVVALITKGFDDTNHPRYKEIKELGKMNGSYVSGQQFLIFENDKFFFTQDPLYKYDEAYTVEEFEKFLTACGQGKSSNGIIFLYDISAIHKVDDPRYKRIFRISNTFRKEQILDNSFIKYVNGEMTFHNADVDTKRDFKEEYPNEKIYDSTTEELLLKRLGIFTPSKKFEAGKTYVVRQWEDMEAEFGVKDGKINNKNLFPKENKQHCGKQFTPTDNTSSWNVGDNAVFPEETYEVDTMANSTIYTGSVTGNGARTTNIFTDEAIPEPPKPQPVKIKKVGKKYYHGDKEVEIADFACEIEIDEKEVNEKRFVAALELGIEYDNLEEKSKRIQDIIKNELDSPEAVADKEWVYIYGASGSGKTTEAKKYFNNKGQEYIKQAGFGQLTGDDLLGYKSITDGTYFRSLLRDAVEYGYGFIFDEMDACNPNTLLILNELKGEEMQFPDKKIKIHEDFRLIATGNTMGFSENYNARTKLDRATSARFSTVEYNLTLLDIGERWGGSYTKRIKDLESKEPREIQREIRQMKQKEGKTNA